MNVTEYVKHLGQTATAATVYIGSASSAAKNAILATLAQLLRDETAAISAANKLDTDQAAEAGLSAAMMDRLTLTPDGISALARAVDEIAALPDPVGKMGEMTVRPNGLRVGRMSIPLGVIAFIYESRPNVTIDAAALCLKSGNAVILRGGKEALNTNLALAKVIDAALAHHNCPPGAVQVINITDREVVEQLLKLEGTIDLLIPRGGESLIRYVNDNARVPVLKHYKGVCHVYIDRDADLAMGLDIAMNSKVHRPGVCNAAETLLVHADVAGDFLPQFASLASDARLQLRGCAQSLEIVPEGMTAATEADWGEEYLAMILAVKVVKDYGQAVAHIRQYGSDHTETIVTKSDSTGMRFISEVHSSLVLINASTRFNDGGQLGMGAEIGISTSKLHAFGPMGIEHLTIKKHIAFGSGQVRE